MAEYSKFGKSKDRQKYLISEPLGLYLISINCPSDISEKGYISEIKMDIKGSVQISGKNVSYTHGEIKSGSQRKLGIIQLLRIQSMCFHSLNAIS